MEVTSIKLALIDEDKDQPRYQFSEEALEELANSIREIGLLSPIKVRALTNGRYKIIYGNRRYKASLMVGLESIPCIISTAADEMEIYFEQIAENLTRENFSPIEEAEAFNKLMNDDRFRSSIKLLSSKLGKPESYIKNKLELLKFGNAVRKLIVSGTQIRKDCLTEDQLMPLKDLPLEFRDTLALTAARDELPVSDVKKIAKLFKDSSISDATKQKLLLKNGSSLIETWSVYEQNRKEKLAREKEKLAREKEKQEQLSLASEESDSMNQLIQNNAVTENAMAGAVNTLQGDHATNVASSNGDISLTQGQGTQQPEQTSTGAINIIHVESSSQPVLTSTDSINKTQYTSGLDEALLQAEELLASLNNGTLQNYEATGQLSVDMLIKLDQLQQYWKAIKQALHQANRDN